MNRGDLAPRRAKPGEVARVKKPECGADPHFEGFRLCGP